MTPLEKLKRTSKRIRFAVFAVLAASFSLALYGFVIEGQWWVTFSDEQFNQLWQQLPQNRVLLSLLISPLVISLVAGIYWLQRLLLELSRGLFFSMKCMSCMKWLAWIAFFATLYSMLWPVLAMVWLDIESPLRIDIRLISLLAVLSLPVIVHLLSAARELDQENKEII